MEKHALILLIQEGSEDERLRQIVAGEDARFRVQAVDRLATGLARIAGGGVDLVILDLSIRDTSEIQRLESFLELRTRAPEIPIIVIGESENESMVVRATKIANADYLTRPQCPACLGSLVRSAIGKRPVPLEPRPYLVPESRRSGVVTAFLGAKGGVGTTTVALNVASALAQWGKVILTEIQPWCGTLSSYFRPRDLTANFAQLLQSAMSSHTEIRAALWPCENIHGLDLLFGPQTAEQCGDAPRHALKSLLTTLSAIPNYLVIDLPPNLSEANRAVIEMCDTLLVVVEREPLCVESAKRIIGTLYKWNAIPSCFGSVIVNRSAYAAPMDLSEIEIQLTIPTFGVIAPDVDLCIAAHKAGLPITFFEPDSIVARSMVNLAVALASPTRKALRAY